MPSRKNHRKIEGGQHEEEAPTAAHPRGALRQGVNGYSVAHQYVNEAESGRIAEFFCENLALDFIRPWDEGSRVTFLPRLQLPLRLEEAS